MPLERVLSWFSYCILLTMIGIMAWRFPVELRMYTNVFKDFKAPPPFAARCLLAIPPLIVGLFASLAGIALTALQIFIASGYKRMLINIHILMLLGFVIFLYYQILSNCSSEMMGALTGR